MDNKDSSRRGFLKKGLASTAFAMLAATGAEAFSLKIPGRDEKDPKHIGQIGKHFVMVLDLRKCIGCQACTSVCKVENEVVMIQLVFLFVQRVQPSKGKMASLWLTMKYVGVVDTVSAHVLMTNDISTNELKQQINVTFVHKE